MRVSLISEIAEIEEASERSQNRSHDRRSVNEPLSRFARDALLRIRES